MQKRNVDWSEIKKIVDSLVIRINNLDIKPDCIVAVGRGGMIPSTLISYSSSITPVYSIGITTRHSGPDLYQELPTSIWEKKHILFIDDINDSGNTFDLVLQEVPESFNGEITFCSLLKRFSSNFNLNEMHGELEPTDRWIVFPWD
jgi:hypoxanthine phosphoribosyltransferase